MAKTMRRKYICTNGVVEVTQFTVGDKTENAPKWHRAKSQDDKRDENARQAVRVAARILNCNYTPEDYLVELTYSDESMEKVLGVACGGNDVEIVTSAAPPRNDMTVGADEIWDSESSVGEEAGASAQSGEEGRCGGQDIFGDIGSGSGDRRIGAGAPSCGD